jgi:hypothetical protein
MARRAPAHARHRGSHPQRGPCSAPRRAPLAGCDRSPGSDPRGTADDGGAGAPIYWGCDPSQTQRIAAHDRLRGQIPGKTPGPLFRSPAILFRPSTRPRLRGCDRGGARWARRFKPARLARCGVAPTPTGAGTAPPSACRPGRNLKGRGAVARPLGQGEDAVAKRPRRGASCCRYPLQYRHIAAGYPPKAASHIASVAHVPTIEIGSSLRVTERSEEVRAHVRGRESQACL